ncbi:hypothetical protein H114_00697 [Streptomyces gancidicus BKS 13-15]|uniref:Uncharacterized protein n=2 Tax=Streptomyces pseudogriseolus TaxID=36817 RepID=M3EBL5_STREZ|nr:hypothetical protein H114_00697 [Streptomyces gancidicus BKS 13-15]
MSHSAEMHAALAASVESTLQHIRLIQQREARLAEARTDAYEVEERLLKEHMPYLNRKASR